MNKKEDSFNSPHSPTHLTHLTHLKYMKIALKLALKGKGFTEPNPMVGAVVVKDGEVAAVGYHRKYGADHAEREAHQKVTIPGTTLYINLEPCSHMGKTPPCADLIIRKKVKRVVVALQDPNPLVDGCGICKLEEKRHCRGSGTAGRHGPPYQPALS